MLQELQDLPSTDPKYAQWQAVNSNNWWHRDAAGNRTQWTTGYSAHNINITDWARPNASGQRWHQVKAKMDNDKLFANMKGLDYVYLDGFDVPLADGDWKLIGTNQSRKDADIVSAYRKGNVAYANSVRALNPSLKFIGNSASIEAPEYRNQIEGAYRECLMGKSWSLETRLGWEAMMDSYRVALANTKATKDVVFGSCNLTADPDFYRYGLASALLEDGYFSFSVNGYSQLPWFDEGDAPLGTAAEAPPTAPTASGLWMCSTRTAWSWSTQQDHRRLDQCWRRLQIHQGNHRPGLQHRPARQHRHLATPLQSPAGRSSDPIWKAPDVPNQRVTKEGFQIGNSGAGTK